MLCLFCLLYLPLISSAQTRQLSQCSEPASFYESDGYRVREIRIDAPLEWLLGSVNERLTSLIADPAMPLKKGEVFRKTAADAALLDVTNNFPELRVSSANRLAFRIVRPNLENCNAQTKTLDVVYRAYTVGFPSYLTRSFERNPQKESPRSVVETPTTRRLSNYLIQPYLGYNRSRRMFGGTKLNIDRPMKLIDKISLDAAGSSSSLTARAEALGSRDYEQGSISHMEWRLGYHYSDVPSNSAHLKEGKLLGQFFAVTRPLGKPELTIRFGNSIEGGHQQTDADPRLLRSADVPRTGYASGKWFAGASLRLGGRPFDGAKDQDAEKGHPLEFRWKGSYGLQIGNTREGRKVDYVKQVVDTAISLRYSMRDHRALTLETQFTAGTIKQLGRLPVTERFFGGNVEQNFIAGDTWKIRGQPLIRSFPQNRLAQITKDGVIGVDGFFSINMTLAATAWSKPMVPREILRDKEFPGMVELQLSGAESELRNAALSRTPKFRALAGRVNQMAELLRLLTNDLNDLKAAVEREVGERDPGPQAIEQIETCQTDLNSSSEAIGKILEDLKTDEQTTADFRELMVGFPKKRPPIPSTIEDLNDSLEAVTGVTGLPTDGVIAAKVESINSLRRKMENLRKQMADGFAELDGLSVEAKRAELKAKREMLYPRRVLNDLLREANLVAFSPVLIFDAARLRQRGLAQAAARQGETRYAIGGGMRLSIVSLDVTFGYAWNPKPKPWEGRGAMLFTIELSNLFR